MKKAGRPKQQPKKVAVKRSKAGLGLFAEEDIKRDEFIIEYTGELLTTEESDDRPNKYLFEVNSRWTIDGSPRSNIARYINHSCRPNCEPDIFGHKIKIYAIKNIKAGEELGYDYGKDHWNEYIKPHGCKCVKCSEKK